MAVAAIVTVTIDQADASDHYTVTTSEVRGTAYEAPALQETGKQSVHLEPAASYGSTDIVEPVVDHLAESIIHGVNVTAMVGHMADRIADYCQAEHSPGCSQLYGVGLAKG